MHHTDLIITVAGALTAALIGGVIAWRIGAPVILGYLLAGMAVGPFTPGFVADADRAAQLAEIGVLLLMFGVGLHFSLSDLWSVRRIAIPGAIGQAAVAVLLGVGLAQWWGWGLGAGIVLGLSLSVASTVVLLRALAQRGILSALEGRVAVGWLIVEDLLMVLALVMLPSLASSLGGVSPGDGGQSIAIEAGITVAKLGAFLVLMLAVGPRVVPPMLGYIERTGSRELYVLAVLAGALALAMAGSELFGASPALGAFLVGVMLSGSAHRARAEMEARPLQDAFSVLFFVSVGMLIDPSVLVDQPHRLLGVLGVVIAAKLAIGFVIARGLGGSRATALTVGVGLAQVGEFSFILLELGRSLELLPAEGRDLVLGAAIISIALNPLLFAAARLLGRRASVVAPVHPASADAA